MERIAQTSINDPTPKCYGLVYDARDVNCTACTCSALCMYKFYNEVIRARIDELGAEKPYFDLTDFEAVTEQRIAEMLANPHLTTEDIVEDIMVNCQCTEHLAKHRLAIIQAKLRYEGIIPS